ncbi:hypothetical protein [Legionella brunensis]|uniref:Uncharacterized protein n=1 Tax=Legionella brunensis TaxID=29422 RepID=A0A0W0S1P7_9GAMM|nr:hypothetical protein [Legionella brunensis]KTC77105.1 hypothetical protein Lbru_3212 [Legionella brunensis]
MSAENAKNLLIQYNQKRYLRFLLNKDETLILPTVSSVPWIGTAGRIDKYRKRTVKHGDHQVNFISKNREFHSFQWQTSPEKLKKAVRWGIVRTESVTGKVISALGNYRVITHERIAKGMISNTQPLKIQFLDHYQQRFEALQALESLVNRDCSVTTYKETIEHYIQELRMISSDLEKHFEHTHLTDINPEAISLLRKDIEDDIERARVYLEALIKQAHDQQALRAYNRARGTDSISEFVKQQMLHNLYQMQGINQDISYSRKRSFALTRGALNDCIEDARKEIDDHNADPRNAVRAEHHGLYSSGNDSVTYDFGQDNLSPARQRQVLLGISFIEGWDAVDYSNPKTPVVENKSGSSSLSEVAATNWKLHRNFKAAVKANVFFIFNIFKGIFTYTHPWEEEAWDNKSFHLVAAELRSKASPNEPLLFKPIKFFKIIINSIKDCFKGIRNFGTELFRTPEEIFNDWKATKILRDYDVVIKKAETEILFIEKEEEERLKHLLSSFSLPEMSPAMSKLAKADYHLTAGEQNDILTVMVRGFDGFSSVFTHNIYAKDPVAGLVFTAAYAAGAAAIFYPAVGSAVFGSSYVNWFSNFSYGMGAGKFAAAIGGGSTQAQAFATAWDTLMHGPNGLGVTVATQIAEDPLTYASYFVVAYTLGYVLVNGVNGHEIPGLSAILKEDLGTTPEASYPFIGGKFAIASYELLHRKPSECHQPLKINFDGTEVAEYPQSSYKEYDKTIAQFRLAFWLSMHASTLPKLSPTMLYELERHIDKLFPPEKAASLKKILYPEKEPSIGFQIFSIPLTYVPAILRLALAFVVSPIAWFMGNPFPAQSIKNAGSDLLAKVRKDLTRILIVGSQLTHVFFKLASSLVKAFAFTVNMIIGRVTGVLDKYPAHSMHKTFAFIHSWFRSVGELLYPARATKSVISADPAHTIREMEHSYQTVLDNLRVVGEQVSPIVLSSSPSEVLNMPSPLQSTSNNALINDERQKFTSLGY